jgi:hypothetical protein
LQNLNTWANFRARLPEHVPKFRKKVAQRSTVALAVVREIADRRCARSRDAPIRLPTNSASTNRPFPLATCCNFDKILRNDVLSIFHIHHGTGGLDFFKRTWNENHDTQAEFERKHAELAACE